MSKQKLNKDEAQKAAKALEVLFTTEYISRRELYKQNFFRGLFFSIGTILGAALIFAIVAWGLTLFDSVPVIGPAFQTIKNSIDTQQK